MIQCLCRITFVMKCKKEKHLFSRKNKNQKNEKRNGKGYESNEKKGSTSELHSTILCIY